MRIIKIGLIILGIIFFNQINIFSNSLNNGYVEYFSGFSIRQVGSLTTYSKFGFTQNNFQINYINKKFFSGWEAWKNYPTGHYIEALWIEKFDFYQIFQFANSSGICGGFVDNNNVDIYFPYELNFVIKIPQNIHFGIGGGLELFNLHILADTMEDYEKNRLDSNTIGFYLISFLLSGFYVHYFVSYGFL